MKNAIIFHGTGGYPDSYWYPYVKDGLEKKGYEVFIPELPNANKANLSDWLPFALENCEFDSETVLIGHSAGCPLILSILENISMKISHSILVAGFYKPLESGGESILQPTYNWEKIKENCSDFIFINSDNDPWGCDDNAGRVAFDKLGGTLIIRHGEGHMGTDKFKQPYKEFPFLVKLVD